MFALAFFIGIYSYIIFCLSLWGLINRPAVFYTTLAYALFVLIYVWKFSGVYRHIYKLKLPKNLRIGKVFQSLYRNSKLKTTLELLLILQALVNLIGVFGPEISFDALWYHLTLPKIYIMMQRIVHIPGGLLYYSDMPKLTEMIYVPAIMFGGGLTAKFIHFGFGILILIAIYKLSRKFFSKEFSLIAALIFYSSLVVGWESITAYIDLSRTFFELMAFWGFTNWYESKKMKWIAISGIMLGLAISSKVLALGSLFIFLLLFAYLFLVNKEKIADALKNLFVFCFFSVLVPLPWFVFSFVHTGNPFYPFFDSRVNLGQTMTLPEPANFIKDVLGLFIFSSDPISPVFLIILPVAALLFFKSKEKIKIFYIYSLAALVFWYLTPKIGGGRFILPYLPVFSILSVYVLDVLKDKKVKTLLLSITLLVAVSSIGYRFLANKKYIPYLLGRQTKAQFLTNNLNFSFGDFYDTDGYFKKTIKPSDTVLLYGFHNLYYADFNFIDSSWVKKGDTFNYIAVQNGNLPARFSFWDLVYSNPVTKVKLYSLGGQQWLY